LTLWFPGNNWTDRTSQTGPSQSPDQIQTQRGLEYLIYDTVISISAVIPAQGSSGRRRPRRPGSLKLSFPPQSRHGPPSFRSRQNSEVQRRKLRTAIWTARTARTSKSCGGLFLPENCLNSIRCPV